MDRLASNHLGRMAVSRFARFVAGARLLAFAGVLGSSIGSFGCGGPDPNFGSRDALADKWFKRAVASYSTGDFDDASQAVDEAVKAAPDDTDTRLLAARIAIAELDYPKVLKLTEGITEPEARLLRGRAFWYSGDVERAGTELDAALKDPELKDPWAREVAKLARSGRGRKPFHMDGAVVSAVEMPSAGSLIVVPCELDGENILAIVATGVAELTIDASTRKEPAWVSLRFGELEVHDVPAVTQDLSAVSKQLGAPIKALIGVHALRRMHVTFDRRGSQFVVRRDESGAPPDASRVPLHYVRGGGMLMRAHLSQRSESPTSFLVDTSQPYPLTLSDESWRKAGLNPQTLKAEPSLPANLRAGYVPYVRLGAFELPETPGVQGLDTADLRKRIGVDFGGVIGAGLLSVFRVTFGDEGRFMWLEGEPNLPESAEPGQAAGPAPAAPPAEAAEEPPSKPAAKPKPAGKAKP